MAVTAQNKIYSNDGATLLYTTGTLASHSDAGRITETGIDFIRYTTTVPIHLESYIYEGDKKFIGVSTTPNSTIPEYIIGQDFEVGSVSYINYYIVESNITDLTNTTWYINDVAIGVVAEEVSFNLKFTSNTNAYTAFQLIEDKYGEGSKALWYDNIEVWNVFDGWLDDKYRLIEINGGDDAQNPQLIYFLQMCQGNEQPDEPTDTKPVYKRVDGAWVKQTAYERVNGEWVKISTAE